MNGQRFITSVLLVSLAMMSGFPLAHGSTAPPPVPRRVEGSAVEGLVPSNVLSPSKGAVEGLVPSAVEGSADATTLPEGVSADWWAMVQEDIRQSEYHVTWQDHTYLPDVDASYHAANRAYNLRTYFIPEGPVAIPRVWPEEAEAPPLRQAQDGAWRWGLALTAWGREGALQPAESATLHTDANCIEYRRGGDREGTPLLTEWYVNDERGLEQGFTIQSPLLPRSAAPLLLELSLTGDLTPHLTDDPSASSGQGGQAIEFTTLGGVRVLRYSDLHAADATGRELPAHFQLPSPARGGAGGGVILITVDDANAVYPITIDPPLATSPDWTAESDQVNARFGTSVGTAGDVNGDGYSDVIVGAQVYDNGHTDEVANRLPALSDTYGTVVAGFSFASPNVAEVLDCLAAIGRPHNVLFVAGGPHPSGDPTGTLDMGFDVIVKGEGEVAFPRLVVAWPPADGELHAIPNLVFRAENGLTKTPRARLINLDDYPPLSVRYGWTTRPIEITRGCPHACGFCQTPFLFGGKMRHRSVASVVEHLERALASPKPPRRVRFVTPDAFAYGSDGRTPNLKRSRIC